MTGNERLTDHGGADAAILVVVQVAPAYSNRRYLDERLAGTSIAQIDRSDADIPRSVEEDRFIHRCFTRPELIALIRRLIPRRFPNQLIKGQRSYIGHNRAKALLEVLKR